MWVRGGGRRKVGLSDRVGVGVAISTLEDVEEGLVRPIRRTLTSLNPLVTLPSQDQKFGLCDGTVCTLTAVKPIAVGDIPNSNSRRLS